MDANAFEKAVQRAYVRRWILIGISIVLALILLGVANSIPTSETSPQIGDQEDQTTTTQTSDLTSSMEETTTSNFTPAFSGNTSGEVSGEGDSTTSAQTTQKEALEGDTRATTGVFFPSQFLLGKQSFIWLIFFLFGIIAMGGVVYTQVTPPTFVNQLLKDNLPATSVKRRINTFNATLKGIELKIRFVPRSNRGNWGIMIIESSIEEADPEIAARVAQRHCIQYDATARTLKTVSTSEELFLKALLIARAKKMLQNSNVVS